MMDTEKMSSSVNQYGMIRSKQRLPPKFPVTFNLTGITHQYTGTTQEYTNNYHKRIRNFSLYQTIVKGRELINT